MGYRWTKFDSPSAVFFIKGWKEVVCMTTIGIRLPKGEKEILVENAQRTDTTISQIVRKLIREYVGSVSPDGETAPPAPDATQSVAPASRVEMKKE